MCSNYSNFALRLAAMYKASDYTQRTLTSMFNGMYDLVQGKVKPDLFNPEPDQRPRTLADAIREVLKIEYEPAKNDIKYGSADVAVDHQTGAGGEPGGGRAAAGGERAATGAGQTERGAGAAGDGVTPGADATGRGGYHLK